MLRNTVEDAADLIVVNSEYFIIVYTLQETEVVQGKSIEILHKI